MNSTPDDIGVLPDPASASVPTSLSAHALETETEPETEPAFEPHTFEPNPREIAAALAWQEDTEEALVRWLPNGTRLAVNAAYCRRYGCAPESLIGKSLIHLLTREQKLRLIARLADLSPEHPTWIEQKPATTPLGKKTWQEWVTRGIFDSQGRLLELQSIGRDITLQKELSLAMDEISRSLLTIRGPRYFEHVVRHLARVLEADACYAGEFIDAEPTGKETDPAKKAPLFRFLAISVDGALENLPPMDPVGTPLMQVMTESFVSIGSHARAKFPTAPLIRRTNAQSYVAAAMRDHDGKLLGAVGVLFRQPLAQANFYAGSVLRLTAAVGASRLLEHRETARRKALELQLREAQKMDAIGQLAGGIAHDFNNLLTILAGHATLLQNLPLPAAAAESVREIAEGTSRAGSLTRQLLMFSRRQVMQFSAHDLNSLTKQSAAALTKILPPGIQLRLDLHPTPLWVEADPGMLDQVVQNLAQNARDAMPGGGVLTLSTAHVEAARQTALTALPFAGLTVTDTGCGIPAENLDRIFEPFFTTKDASQGSGIGLSAVYTIVGQHQGYLKAESIVGTGTAIHVLLPLAEAPDRLADPVILTHNPSATPPPAAVSPARQTVLVVEDEAPLRLLVRRVLEQEGYRVVDASSGRRAMDFSQEDVSSARLLITDLVMPEGVNGWETAERLRARNPDLRVIYTSGYDASTAGQTVHLAPGSGFLPKPWQCADLAVNVRSLLNT